MFSQCDVQLLTQVLHFSTDFAANIERGSQRCCSSLFSIHYLVTCFQRP